MFFSPPKPLATAVFASYPSEFHTATGENDWVQTQPQGAHHTSLLEGPSFNRNGVLWCVDIPNGRILNVSPEGTFSVAVAYDGWPTGLKIHRDGRVFVTDAKYGIMVLDPETGAISPYLVRAALERFKAVNDLFFAANGDMWFTDQGLTGWQDPTGRLFRVRPTGAVECVLDCLPSPNGLVMNLDETMVYVAVTRANAIWRVPLMRDGRAAKVGTFVQLSGGGGPDGLALDSEGRLFIAHVGLGVVWVVDRLGQPVYRIEACSGHHTTNMAFGGPDRKTLFITESAGAKILTTDLEVPGKIMFSGA